jgi:acyl dehydratase
MPEITPKDQHSSVRLYNTENWMYEEFEIGRKDRSISRTISEGEAMQFNCMVMDLHPYVADERFARERGLFNRRLVAGAMVFSYGLGLFANNNIHTFSYGYDKLRFINPVFIGDTIYGIRTHLEKRPKYGEMGLIRVSYEIFKEDAEQVLYCEHIQTVKYRHPENWRHLVEKK